MSVFRSLRLWAALALLGWGALGAAPAFSEEIILSGSSMLYPANRDWARGYERHHPSLRIRVLAPGSGAGIAGTVEGNVSIGASDIFLSPRALAKKGSLVLLPVALEGVVPVVNLPAASGRSGLTIQNSTPTTGQAPGSEPPPTRERLKPSGKEIRPPPPLTAFPIDRTDGATCLPASFLSATGSSRDRWTHPSPT